jgi:signal transduction histidine kinase
VNLREQEILDLLKRGYELRSQSLKKAIDITEQALKQSETARFDVGVAKAQNQLALFALIQGSFDKALHYSKVALGYFEQRGDRDGIATSKYNIASVLYRTDNFHQSLLYFLDSLAIFQKLGDYHNQARVLKSMGTVYEFFNDYENAENAYLQCIEASKHIGDLNSESNAYNPLSGLFLKKGLTVEAMQIIERSIALKQHTNDIRGLAFSLYGRGKVYLATNQFDKALIDLRESLAMQIEAGDKLGTGMAYNKLGLVYTQLKEYDTAQENFLQALHLAEALNLRFVRFKAYYNLYSLAKLRAQTQEALDYLEKYIHYKETVINTATLNIIKSYATLTRIQTLEQEAKSEKEKINIIEEKNLELDSFFYRVSHDLKGPISSLLGLHQVVKVDVIDENALAYFTMYHHQIQRINNIVMSLIDITRMKHIEIQKQKIDFEALVNDCINSYQYVENFSSIKFIKEIEVEIDFNSEWAIINTILQNLIENAIKYARKDENAFVRIAIYQSKAELYMIVEDNGQGIPEKHKTKIFEMFHRANDRVQGSGLGLYILKRAVERLKGSIEVDSEINLGSKFIVKLPVE